MRTAEDAAKYLRRKAALYSQGADTAERAGFLELVQRDRAIACVLEEAATYILEGGSK